MNSFANSLFSLLFGWARTLIQQVWTAASTGGFSAFFTWLGDHWVWVVVLLCLAGTALDFLIWIIRWRPYLVWRTNWRKFQAWLRGGGRTARRFEAGYQGGVGLEIPMEEPSPQEEDWDVEDWDTPAAALLWQQEPEEEPPSLAPSSFFASSGFAASSYPRPEEPTADPGHAPAPVVNYAPDPVALNQPPEEDDSARRRVFAPAPAYELPPIGTSTRVPSSFSAELPTARRKRRSDKYERRKPAWDKLMRDEDEENAMLDGLPPAVDRDQAFHEPVYPQPQAPTPENAAYYAWQRPLSPQQTNGNSI